MIGYSTAEFSKSCLNFSNFDEQIFNHIRDVGCYGKFSFRGLYKNVYLRVISEWCPQPQASQTNVIWYFRGPQFCLCGFQDKVNKNRGRIKVCLYHFSSYFVLIPFRPNTMTQNWGCSIQRVSESETLSCSVCIINEIICTLNPLSVAT